ncbi:MAG: 23S rRNA (adenine(2503)-C(2))-methyltransferase RlmN, partial [Spirochaetales bacterium]
MTDKTAVDGKPAIFLSGLFPEEINRLVNFGQSFRAKQVYEWIVKGSGDFAAMSNLPSTDRERLGAVFGRLRSSSVSSEFKDEDGSLKLQIRLRD